MPDHDHKFVPGAAVVFRTERLGGASVYGSRTTVAKVHKTGRFTVVGRPGEQYRPFGNPGEAFRTGHPYAGEVVLLLTPDVEADMARVAQINANKGAASKLANLLGHVGRWPDRLADARPQIDALIATLVKKADGDGR